MKFDDYEAIAFERRGRVLVIRLNQPDTMNAIDGRLHGELARVFRDVQTDEDADVIVLTGSGRAFSAGGDIDGMQRGVDHPEVFERIAREAKDIIYSQLDLEKPLICRLNGHATGLGATIALTCDIIVATERAKIGDPHVSVGLVAGDGGAILWPQLVGYARARKYLFTGELMTAAEAERIGLITEVVPEDKLDEATFGLAERLATGATKAIRWTKITTNLALKQLIHSYFDTGIAYEALSSRTRDHAEAVAAFRERRPPKFTGQ